MKKLLTILILIGGALFLASCGEKDNLVEEYGLPEDHVIVEKTSEEIFTAQENSKSFIIMFGFPECPYCQAAIPVISSTAKNMNLEVWYWNPKEDRTNMTETYLKMLDLVGLQRPASEDRENQTVGYDRIAVPFVAVINDGKVGYYPDNQLSLTFPEGENVAGGHTKVDVDGQEKIISTYMWDASRDQLEDAEVLDALAVKLEELYNLLNK